MVTASRNLICLLHLPGILTKGSRTRVCVGLGLFPCEQVVSPLSYEGRGNRVGFHPKDPTTSHLDDADYRFENFSTNQIVAPHRQIPPWSFSADIKPQQDCRPYTSRDHVERRSQTPSSSLPPTPASRRLPSSSPLRMKTLFTR